MNQEELFQNSTSSREECRVSPSVSPTQTNAKVRRMTATSGRSCLKLLNNKNPLLSLSKMLLASSTWHSTMCSLTWKAKATPRNRILFQLAASTRPIDVNGVGLFPTPTVEGNRNKASLTNKSGNGLQTIARMWPTPRASEWKGTGPLGSKSHKHRLERGYLDATVQEVNQESGSLSPNWVAWMMGFPRGWLD